MSIVVIGDSMLDINYNGRAEKLAQEACIPVINVDTCFTRYAVGGAANVYNNINKMGLDTILISVVGCDNDGTILECMCEEINPKSIILKDSTRPTTVKNRFYVNKKIVFRYDIEETTDIPTEIETSILRKFQDNISSYRLLILSDYNKGVLTTRLTKLLIAIAVTNHIEVCVDPKLKNIFKYENSFLIKPNQLEGEAICKYKITKDNYFKAVKDITEITKCHTCLLTLGENGMIVFDGKKTQYIETQVNEVIDITGAGDVVMASFVFYYLKTRNIFESTKFANYCGQIKVKNFGTYAITQYDILTYEKTLNKVIPIDDLEYLINIIRTTDKKIVITNGCFDIIHVGHLSFLEKAKECGDILIVGLNSDKSVKMNKGETRPINDIVYRCKQLSMISCIDYVVVFEDKTPMKFIEIVKPDILVKGGDYIITQILGREFAKETRIIDYTDGFSTTNIIKKIDKVST